MRYRNVYNRLRKIEGQVRGIEGMLEKEKSDTEILIQLEAAKSSLSSAHALLIEEMLKLVDGKVILAEKDIKAILRSIKRP